MTVRARLRDIAAAVDTKGPKDALLDSVGNIDGFVLLDRRVLVATYVPGEYVGNSKLILRTDRNLDEGRFQGKVGIVLKVGDLMPADMPYREGDWVMYRASDGFEMFFVRPDGASGTPCRVLAGESVIAKLEDPGMVY